MNWEEVKNAVQKDHEYVRLLRREFHRHPELAKEEFFTAARIEEELDKLGLPHERSAGTGVVATLTGTAGGSRPKEEDGAEKCILLRADIDALPVTELHECEYKSEIPGKMHACGHDAHAAALIGAARVLSTFRDRFAGSVRLVFQPGEEVGYGAQAMIREGIQKGCTRSFGIHMASDVAVGKAVLMPGPNNASVDWFRITVEGLGAHVSTPQRGVDAAYIAAQIVVGAQALVTRMSSPMDHLLIGIGTIQAGTAYNVVADHAVMEGTIRSLDAPLRAKTKERLEKLARETAAIYGGTASMEWNDNTSVLVNSEKETLEAQKIAAAVLGEDKIIRSRKASLGGDDMAEFINEVPGCYAYVGSCDPAVPETGLAHHHACFDIAEDALRVAVLLYSAAALDYLGAK